LSAISDPYAAGDSPCARTSMGRVTNAWLKRIPTSRNSAQKARNGRSRSGNQNGGDFSCSGLAGRVSGIRSQTMAA